MLLFSGILSPLNGDTLDTYCGKKYTAEIFYIFLITRLLFENSINKVCKKTIITSEYGCELIINIL